MRWWWARNTPGWRACRALWGLLFFAATCYAQTCAQPYTLLAPSAIHSLQTTTYGITPSPRGEFCVWTAPLVDTTQVVQVVITADMQPSVDYLKIYDGNSTSAPLLATVRRSMLSAGATGANAYSTGPVVTVEYLSGQVLEGSFTGFQLCLLGIDRNTAGPLGGDEIRTLRAVYGTPNVTNGPYAASTPSSTGYPRNFKTVTTITSPPGMVVRIVLKEIAIGLGDSLVIYDDDTTGNVLGSISARRDNSPIQFISESNHGPDASTVGGRLVLVFTSGPNQKFIVSRTATKPHHFAWGYKLEFMAVDPPCEGVVDVRIPYDSGNTAWTFQHPTPVLTPSGFPNTFGLSYMAYSMPAFDSRGALRVCGFRLDAGEGRSIAISSIIGATISPYVYDGYNTSAPLVVSVGSVVFGRYAYVEVAPTTNFPDMSIRINYDALNVSLCDPVMPSSNTWSTGPPIIVSLSYANPVSTPYEARRPYTTCAAHLNVPPGEVVRLSCFYMSTNNDDYFEVWDVATDGAETLYTTLRGVETSPGLAFNTNTEHAKIVYVAGGGKGRGLQFSFIGTTAPTPCAAYQALAVTTTTPLSIYAFGMNGQMSGPRTCLWNLTAVDPNIVIFNGRQIQLRVNDTLRIFHGPWLSSPLLDSYSGLYADYPLALSYVYSSTSHVLIQLTVGPMSTPTIPNYIGFSTGYRTNNTAPVNGVPNQFFPALSQVPVPASGSPATFVFPKNLPLNRRYQAQFTLASGGPPAEGLLVTTTYTPLNSGSDESWAIYEGTNTSRRLHYLDASCLAWSGMVVARGARVLIEISTGHFGDRGDASFTVTAWNDTGGPTAADSCPQFNTTTTTITASQTFSVLGAAHRYATGMRCEWVFLPQSPTSSLEIRFLTLEDMPGASLTLTHMATGQTRDLRAFYGTPSDVLLRATWGASVKIVWHVSDGSTPGATPVWTVENKGFITVDILCPPVVHYGMPVKPYTDGQVPSGGTATVMSATSTPGTTPELTPWSEPFECGFHFVAGPGSAWVLDADSGGIASSDVQLVIHDGHSAEAPVAYDSRIDPHFGAVGVPAGSQFASSIFVRLILDPAAANMPATGALNFNNAPRMPQCKNETLPSAGYTIFHTGSAYRPGTVCVVTILPSWGLAVLTASPFGALGQGDFVDIYSSNRTLIARYGRRDGIFTAPASARRALDDNLWNLPRHETITIEFHANAVVEPRAEARGFGLALNRLNSDQTNSQFGFSIDAFNQPRACDTYVATTVDATAYAECAYMTQNICPSGAGDIFMPNVTWIWQISPSVTPPWRLNLPRLRYVSDCITFHADYNLSMPLLEEAHVIKFENGLMTDLTLPSLRYVTGLSLSNLPNLMNINVPQLFKVTTLYINNAPYVTAWNSPAVINDLMVYNTLGRLVFDNTTFLHSVYVYNNATINGNLTFFGEEMLVYAENVRGLQAINAPNAVYVDLYIRSSPLTVLSLPKLEVAISIDVMDTQVATLDFPSLTCLTRDAFRNINLHSIGTSMTFLNISSLQTLSPGFSMVATSIPRLELPFVRDISRLFLIDNAALSVLQVCDLLDQVHIEGSPLLSCSAVNTSLQGDLVPSYDVRDCGSFPGTVVPCPVPPPPPPPPPVAAPPSPPPAVNATGCVDPGVPLNGSRILVSGFDGSIFNDTGSATMTFETGDMVYYMCDPGFRLLGRTYITCRATGAWSGAVPTCTDASYDPPAPTIDDVTPHLAALHTAVNVTLYGRYWNLPLRNIDTGDGVVRDASDLTVTGGGVARRRLLQGETDGVKFEVPPRQSSGYLVVTLEDGYGLQATDDVSLYFTDDCPSVGTFGIGLDCHVCPRGGYCPGGNRVWPLPGYWNEGETSGHVLECPEPPSRCLGGRSSSCAPGYQGPICGSCQARYYLRGTECVVCPPASEETGLYIAAGIFFSLIAVVFCTLSDERVDALVVVIRLLQLLRAGSAQGGARLPEGFKDFVFYLSLVTFDFEFIKPTCGFLESYPYFNTIFWGNAVIVGMLVLPTMIALLILQAVVPARRDFYRNRMFRAGTIQVSLLYYVVSVRALQAVTCIPVGTGSFLLADPTLVCKPDALSIIGGLGLATLTAAVPVASLYFVHRLARTGHWTSLTNKARYGFLYQSLVMQGYRHLYVVLPFLQLLCAALAWTVLKTGFAPYILSAVSFGVLFLVSAGLRPYVRGFDNSVAVLSYGIGLASTILGLCSLSILSISQGVAWGASGGILVISLLIAAGLVALDARAAKRRNKIEPKEKVLVEASPSIVAFEARKRERATSIQFSQSYDFTGGRRPSQSGADDKDRLNATATSVTSNNVTMNDVQFDKSRASAASAGDTKRRASLGGALATMALGGTLADHATEDMLNSSNDAGGAGRNPLEESFGSRSGSGSGGGGGGAGRDSGVGGRGGLRDLLALPEEPASEAPYAWLKTGLDTPNTPPPEVWTMGGAADSPSAAGKHKRTGSNGASLGHHRRGSSLGSNKAFPSMAGGGATSSAAGKYVAPS